MLCVLGCVGHDCGHVIGLRDDSQYLIHSGVVIVDYVVRTGYVVKSPAVPGTLRLSCPPSNILIA